jgi:iron complex transport system substrate-binding protein
MKNKTLKTVVMLLLCLLLTSGFTGCTKTETATTSTVTSPEAGLTTTATKTALPGSTATALASTAAASSTTPTATSTPSATKTSTPSPVQTTTSSAPSETSSPATPTPISSPTPAVTTPSTTTPPSSTTTSTTTTAASSGGGGGGSGVSYNANIFGTKLTFSTESSGKVKKTFTGTSKDKAFTFTIPQGTLALTSAGKRLNSLTATLDDQISSAPNGSYIVSDGYCLEPQGATFNPAIKLTYKYDPADVPEDVAVDTMNLAYEENGAWIQIEGTLNTSDHTITTSVDHFSTFALVGNTTRQIKDMYYDVSGTDSYHKMITVPAVINKVLSGGPVETQLIYMLAPEKLCALNGTIVGLAGDVSGGWTATTSFWNTSWWGDTSLVPEKYLDQAAGGDIPDIGNGSSKNLSYEQINLADPDIVIEGKTSNLATYRSKIQAPVVGVNSGSSLCWDFINEIQYVGDLLDVPDKANELIAYYQEAMDYVNVTVQGIRPSSINQPDNSNQVRVYYAQGTDGYMTDAKGSWHTNLLWFCGGANVANVAPDNSSGAVAVDGEDILAWDEADPIDLIIIGRSSQNNTYHTIMSDPVFQSLACVQLGKVIVRPDNPTSWFDGPPGYGQIIGMYWLVDKLYPDRTVDLNLAEKIKEFYSKFLHYSLTTAQVNQLLQQPGQ